MRHWVILSAATFTPGNWKSGVNVANIRSSASPNAASQSLIYYRSATLRDPLVAVSTDINTGTIYYGESSSSYAFLLNQASSFGGFSVWLRLSPAIELPECLSAFAINNCQDETLSGL